MSSPIRVAFEKANNENRPALLTYTVAGDSNKKISLNILKKISDYVDICEIGFPHNTPIADGGQIQTSSYRAIKKGIKIKIYDNKNELYISGVLINPNPINKAARPSANTV